MLLEVALGCVTSVTLGAFWLADRVTKRDVEERKRENEERKRENEEELRRHRNPEVIKAAYAAQRAILIERKKRWESHLPPPTQIDQYNAVFKVILEHDNQLFNLAASEANELMYLTSTNEGESK